MPDPSLTNVPGLPNSYHPHSLVNHSAMSRLKTKHRGMVRFEHLAVPQIHVHAARQTRVKTPYRAHYIDSLELVRAIFLEDRRVLHRVFVRTRSAIDVPRIGIPGSRR